MTQINTAWLRKIVVIVAAVFAGLGLLTLVPVAAIDGPDVVIESIALDPLIPAPGQPFSITIVTRNQGNISTGGSSFLNYVYLDPAARPPTSTTLQTYQYGAFLLGPGGSASVTRSNDPNLAFATAGCNHVIYAWADKTNLVAETVETNNVLSQTVCVGVTCQPDTYEPDNTCEAATWLTNTLGLPQHHTLCPMGDEDWVRFSTIAGVTYTLEAKNLGLHADPLLSLLNGCGGVAQFGTGPSIVWRSLTSGIAYVKVAHRLSTYGPLTGYDLTLTANTSGLYDVYEPDDTCTSARDLPTDGSRQTHYFQSATDVDWVKFPIDSGQTAVVIADNPGPGVSPRVQVYNSCEQIFGEPVAYGPQAQVETGSDGLFYAQVINQNAGVSGQTAFYDLSMALTGCAPDSADPDDTAATAKLVSTTGVTRTHTSCPAGDQDWVKFQAISGTTYMLETSNLGLAADTELGLYGPDGTTQLAYNDDYAVSRLDSRIVWRAPATGTYYARVQQVKSNIAGPNTRYDFSISEGACLPDAYEGTSGDNSALNASPIPLDGSSQTHSFCPIGDQDWVRFVTLAPNTKLTIRTSSLSSGYDSVLSLYGPDGATLLAANDDYGAGGDSLISQTVSAAGAYYVRVVPYNTNQFGSNTTYQLSVSGAAPPTPTPTPTPWPTPTPSPTPPTVTSGIRTLIVVNRERITALHGATAAADLMTKLYELANHARVKGVVLQVELSPAVSTAYSQWTANLTSLLDTDKANNVASAVRNMLLTYLGSGPDVKYIVLVGDDRIIPFRRTKDWTSKPENNYAASVTLSTTQWAAFRDGMSLTDNYYADKIPTTWAKGELYLPDYAVGRLIETPTEIMGFIDAFLASDGISSNRALITGYDFVKDTASLINTSFQDDTFTTDSSLIGFTWSADDLRSKQLASVPRFDIQAINGHANHTTELAPPPGGGISAAEIASSTANLAGAVIFTVGCHAGFNDSGDLDLAQAFAQKKAYYVANTGFGWGGGGVVYSEALMNYFARLLLLGTSSEIGPTLAGAKSRYYNQVSAYGLDGYDDKVLAEATLYGLPMFRLTTGAAFGEDNPFPNVALTSTTPGGAFGGLNVGHLAGVLPGSFGAFGQVTDTLGTFFGEGSFFALNDSTQIAAGQPVQPKFYANVSAPTSGRLHGVLFRGGVYTDVQGFDPVIAQPFNEYVTPTGEPAFEAAGFYPPVPFSFNSQPVLSGSVDTLVTLMGQYNSQTSAERLYDHLSFDTYYSADPDMQPPTITYLDAVLNKATGRGTIKLEANDATGIERAVVVFTEGVGAGSNGVWSSQDLVYDAAAFKWKADITATLNTRYFVQVVDKAGNIQTLHNKGRYYQILPPVGVETHTVFLPLALKY